MCMGIFPVCMSVYYRHSWCPQWPEENIRFLGIELQMSVSCHVDAGN